jgi:hypothetical protein
MERRRENKKEDVDKRKIKELRQQQQQKQTRYYQRELYGITRYYYNTTGLLLRDGR